VDINQLEYFRTVAKLQNVTRAAESLYITQPNLSMSLTKLEKELGIKLFNRRKGSVTLTTKGEIFLYFVNRALGELNDGLSFLEDRGKIVSARVDVASSLAGLLPRLIDRFTGDGELGPYIHLLARSEEVYGMLEEGILDFAVTTVPRNNLSIRWTPVREDALVLLVPEGHALAQRESVTIEDLAAERIVCADPYLEKETINDLCIKVGFFPNIVVHGNEFISPDRAILPRNAGVMPVLSHMLPAIRRQCPPTFRAVPFSGLFSKVAVGVAVNTSRSLSAAAKAFYDYAMETLPALVGQDSLLQ